MDEGDGKDRDVEMEVHTPEEVPHVDTAKPVEPSLEATQVVPTPCRNASKSVNAGPDTPVFTDHESPDPKDTETPGSKEASTPGSISTDLESERPTPGELRLSQNAVNLRMHRMMKVDSKGN